MRCQLPSQRRARCAFSAAISGGMPSSSACDHRMLSSIRLQCLSPIREVQCFPLCSWLFVTPLFKPTLHRPVPHWLEPQCIAGTRLVTNRGSRKVSGRWNITQWPRRWFLNLLHSRDWTEMHFLWGQTARQTVARGQVPRCCSSDEGQTARKLESRSGTWGSADNCMGGPTLRRNEARRGEAGPSKRPP